MAALFTEITLKGKKVRNRTVLPPMVCFGWAKADGHVTERHIKHYTARAEGGAGIIIVEATCVSPLGRLSMDQLGLWERGQLPGLGKIAAACTKNGALPLMQINHAGLKTAEGSADIALGPSADAKRPEKSRALEIDEISGIAEAFVRTAVLAREAGFAGVELHGAHGYLLSQFASPYTNLRSDKYGGALENRLRLHCEINNGIRQACGGDFIIGIRIGCNEPDIEGGVAVAMHLEKNGFDLIHVSASGHSRNKPEIPEGFEYNWIVRGGCIIRKAISLPVIAVNDIRTPERASYLIEEGLVDFVAIGHDWLTDPMWAIKAENNEKINVCLRCKKECSWFSKPEGCPEFPAELL